MKKKKKKRKKQPRRGVYLLPNLFTSASLFSGFFAIVASIQERFEAAAAAILVSCLFDALDGKIARYTQTDSLFGMEYDSLSDLVAFGVAPAILAFQWALEPFGRLGWLAGFTYLVCGALRLARFNVQKSAQKSKFFRGLPIPGAASFIASLVLFSSVLGHIPGSRPYLVLITMYLLSFLMVSTLDYFSLKQLEIRRQKPFNVLVSIILVLIVVAYKPKVMLFFILSIYVASGPLVTWFNASRARKLGLVKGETGTGPPGPVAKEITGHKGLD